MARAFGIDISKYDYSFTPTPLVEFVIQRASYGTPYNGCYVDDKFYQLHPGVLQVPVRGGYTYLNSNIDWKKQADFYLSIKGVEDFQFHCCDLETGYNVMSANFVSMAMEWLRYVKSVTGKPTVLYTNTSIYKGYVNRFDALRASQYPLWLASYYYNFNGYMTREPDLPTGRKDWKIWQFVPGEWGHFGYESGVGRKGVDSDVYNGTIEEMKEWLGITGKEETHPVEKKDIITVTAPAGLRVRAKATTSSSHIKTLKQNTQVELLSLSVDAYGNIWGSIQDGYIALKYFGAYYTNWRE